MSCPSRSVRIVRADVDDPEYQVVADRPNQVLVPLDFTDEQATETAQRLQARHTRLMAAYAVADDLRADGHR